MNTSILPDHTVETKTSDVPVNDFAHLIQRVVDRAPRLGIDPYLVTLPEVFTIYQAFKPLMSEGVKPTDQAIDHELNKLFTEVDRMPGCSERGNRINPKRHIHRAIVDTFGSVDGEIIHSDGEWHVKTSALDTDLTAEEARDTARALNAAADEAEALNGNTLRRPTDYCAEPQLEGIGGGL